MAGGEEEELQRAAAVVAGLTGNVAHMGPMVRGTWLNG
jgi:3-hydroxyisobutyrate dehydrogenase-like beta-hydroxyacid dehydrogenase